jgi:hypothetical protein
VITKKHLVLNALTGQHTYLENKEDVAPLVVQYALDLYYAQTSNLYYRTAFVDEHNYEYMDESGKNGAEIPPELLADAIRKINEVI